MLGFSIFTEGIVRSCVTNLKYNFSQEFYKIFCKIFLENNIFIVLSDMSNKLTPLTTSMFPAPTRWFIRTDTNA